MFIQCFRRLRTALRARSISSSPSSSSSLHWTSRSSSSSPSNSIDSISSNLDYLNVYDYSTSSDPSSSSSSGTDRLPEPSTITVIKSIRLIDQLSMRGYTYQMKSNPKQKKTKMCSKKIFEHIPFFFYQKIFIFSLVKLLLSYDFSVEDYTKKKGTYTVLSRTSVLFRFRTSRFFIPSIQSFSHWLEFKTNVTLRCP